MFDQTIDYWGGREHSDAWRAAALERIEKIRRGDLTVRVLNAAGLPVPHAEVKVRQQRHYFRFGTAVPAGALVDTETPDRVRVQQVIPRLFNTVTFENDLKWQALDRGPSEDEHFAIVDRAVAWCRARAIAVRGHCLLWGSYQYLPARFRDLRGDALLQACRAHVTDFVTRMKGRVYVWDVVNEAASHVEVWDSLGWPAFAEAFRWARAADPEVKLCYNDFGILSHGIFTDDRNHAARVAARVQYLLDSHAPLEVLGIQAHMGTPLVPIPLVLQRLDRWAAFGKDLEITEYDLGCLDDEIHGEYMRDILTLAFSEPRVKSFLMWGFWEGSHWRAAEGGAMFRRDWSERPAVQAYEDLVLRQWWTNWQGATEADGTIHLRAFYGLQEITVEAGGQTATTTVELIPGGAGEVALRLQ
jgi:GH35 family endo-1,4-beta-xylanase